MTAEDHPRRRQASPQQAGVMLGGIALGSTFAVTSSLPEGFVAGLAGGAAAYAVTRLQRRSGGRES